MPPEKNLETLRALLEKHPLISPIELREAFGFDNTEQVEKFIAPLIDSGEIKFVDAGRGRFIEKILEG